MFRRYPWPHSLTQHPDKFGVARLLAKLLRPGGAISLAESLPRRAQRLYALLDLTLLGGDLAQRLVEAEEAIYQRADDPMVNWDADDLSRDFEQAGLDQIGVEIVELPGEYPVTTDQVARWFSEAASPRPSYAQHLANASPQTKSPPSAASLCGNWWGRLALGAAS
jgi:putative ATPase